MNKLFSATILPYLSSLMAIIAIAVTIWQIQVSKQFNKIAIMPKLEIRFLADPDGREHAYEILNNGLGPATVKSIQVFLNNNKMNKQAEIFHGFLSKAGIIRYCVDVMDISASFGINPGAKKILIQGKKKNNCHNTKKLKQLDAKLSFIVDYQDMKGNNFTYKYH